VQALNYAKFDDNDENEICVLFVLEKLVQELGFVGESEFPKEATSCLDPWVTKYSLQDMVLVMTLLTLGIVQKLVLKKPEGIRVSQGATKKPAPTEEEIEKVREEREKAAKKLVLIRPLRLLYSSILEERMLSDLLDFHDDMKNKPDEMKIFTKSRIEIFKNLRNGNNTSKRQENTKKGGMGGGGAGEESKEEKRRRLSIMMKGGGSQR
jgi:hypothetical protein